IARAAEGSVRDGLSLLDQAIAHCGSALAAERVQAMLGLVDRGRIIDLFEAMMTGDIAAALREIEAQHAQGADPQNLLIDLADFVHWVTRLKIVPAAEADLDRSEAERTRGVRFAKELSMASLTRAWQMLLKGLAEIRDAPDALAAAEMIIIRLCYGAALPGTEELVKIARDSGAAASSRSQAGEPPRHATHSEAPHLQPGPAPEIQGTLAIDQPSPRAEEKPPVPQFHGFRDVVAYVGDKRDIKLKNELERHVRPVRLSMGSIEIALEEGAPPGLAGELARKLEAWTGQRWMVSISNEPGEPPLREQARARRDSTVLEVRNHPVVKAVFEKFPGAEISDVRDPEPLIGPADPSDNSEPD
ncbi:MAG TPA: DNA polymerase III subunit gamma/tau, partial [Aestuariivirgaceae bacterium]|nr:DNA polymerase III subunit gamma/tau [Aestuariivirgaceae bacterium]